VGKNKTIRLPVHNPPRRLGTDIILLNASITSFPILGFNHKESTRLIGDTLDPAKTVAMDFSRLQLLDREPMNCVLIIIRRVGHHPRFVVDLVGYSFSPGLQSAVR
jgi:hypothetical protein